MQTSPSGTKSAPWLVSFKRVIRCDIGVTATGCLLQPYVQKNMTVFISLCTFSALCNYPCHLYRAATAAEPTQMYNSDLELGKKRNILAHKILLGGVSVCFLSFKVYAAEKKEKKNVDCPKGLILSLCCQWKGWVDGPGNAAQIKCLFTQLGCK